MEAKRAVPRDDQRMIIKNNGSVPGSPVPGRTKKIFVGGLPSTLMESDFKKYFDQFGIITDVVMMYDHNTQRPRGFGFITFDSEDAVDRALVKTFHELNGKIVEVKRAVPKELSNRPTIGLPINGYSYGMNRANFVNGYIQGYKPSMIDNYGMQMDGRIGPLANDRNGFSSVAPGFGMETDYEQTMNSNFAGHSVYTNHPSYGQTLNPYYDGNSIGHSSSTAYGGHNENSSSIFSSIDANAWVDFMLNNANKSATSNASRASESGSIVGSGSGSLNWDSSFSSQLGGNGSGYNSGSPGYQGGDYIVFGSRTNERRISPAFPDANLTTTSGYNGIYTKLFDSTSVYGDPTWQLSLPELVSTVPFSYKLGKSEPDTADIGFADYMASYKMKNKQPDQGKQFMCIYCLRCKISSMRILNCFKAIQDISLEINK